MIELKVKAPDLTGIKAWINSQPLVMDKLKGKVVVLDFWTYTCINCLRTIPYVERWHEKYSDSGLVVIGVHTPEFLFEAELNNVKKAVKDLGITYPVALDSDHETWEAYTNSYWPSKYLIDKEGNVVHVLFGEGGYSDFEGRIQEALGVKEQTEKDQYPTYMMDQSPETYMGYIRNGGLGSGLACDKSGCDVYIDPGEHERDVIYPNGQWVQEMEYIELKKAPGQLAFRFNSREFNAVMGPTDAKKSVNARIIVDGKDTGTVKIDAYRMYTLFEHKRYEERELVLLFDGPVRVFVFTFG